MQHPERISVASPPSYLCTKANSSSLIAIMLGRLGMGVDQCIEKYLELSERVFQPKRAKANLMGRAKDKWATDGKYRAEGLAREVKLVMEEMGEYPDAPLLCPGAQRGCRV